MLTSVISTDEQFKNIARLDGIRVNYESSGLKRLAQAKIIKKSVISFWLLNMTTRCKHAHRLELQKFLNFSAAHSPVRLDIETKCPYFYFLIWLSIIRNQEFRL